jgi:hypothetical protein
MVAIMRRPAAALRMSGERTSGIRCERDRSRVTTPNCTAEHQSERATGSANGTILRAANWLRLAAAPTFAVMALLVGGVDKSLPSALCGGTADTSPLSGMAVMYLLMSVFHSASWLELLSCRR